MARQVDSTTAFGITNEDYHKNPAISASHLHAVNKSPYHYWARFLDPNRKPFKATASMQLGTLVHCAVLEPDQLELRYQVCGPRNTKAGKEQAADLEARGIHPVTQTDWDTATLMARNVLAHPVARELFGDGVAEQSVFWTDPTTGLQCKCRPDWMSIGRMVDLKTTKDASPRGFARSVATYRYHVQQEHYIASGIADDFIFVAVESEYPHPVGVYILDGDACSIARSERATNLQTIAFCRESDSWPGYPNYTQTLSLPNWATYVSPEDF